IENKSLSKVVPTSQEGTILLVDDEVSMRETTPEVLRNMGYQVIEASNGDVTYILDTKKENNVILHFAKELPKNLKDPFTAKVDETFRARVTCNHSATHLLHQALRTILGTHVEQKGSAINPKQLRFDFSHFSKLSKEELIAVENFVNARIEAKIPLQEQRNIPMEEAISEGAMALFGEKYGDTVRTIRFGKSIELCGGTHVQNTSDLWHFKIVSEAAVASGIRRIEAITNQAVKQYYFEVHDQLHAVKSLLNQAQDPIQAVENLQEENSALKKQLDQLLKEKTKQLTISLKEEFKLINGVQFLAKAVDLDAAAMKDLSFDLGSKADNLFLVLASAQDGKAVLSCYISKELVAERQLNAGNMVRELGKHIQGGGGGQPFFATAGGKNPDGIDAALSEAQKFIQNNE
ncbi:MAG: DHHA1 domain-containing protein, partial [Flavobacteriaceae bacterium]|nr:DHHA1 domain-containing protein [Flavobacteriaceae bacterium]